MSAFDHIDLDRAWEHLAEQAAKSPFAGFTGVSSTKGDYMRSLDGQDSKVTFTKADLEELQRDDVDGHHRARIMVDEVGYWHTGAETSSLPYYLQREQVPAICRHKTRMSVRFMHGATFYDCEPETNIHTGREVWVTETL